MNQQDFPGKDTDHHASVQMRERELDVPWIPWLAGDGLWGDQGAGCPGCCKVMGMEEQCTFQGVTTRSVARSVKEQ